MIFSSFKYSLPQAMPGALERQALIDQLLGNKRAKVVIIHGPAGFGKTTLMSQYARCMKKHGHKVAWVLMDKADNDVSRFTQLLHQGLLSKQKTDLKVRPSTLDDGVANWDWLPAMMADSESPHFLFLDEFEAITDPVILSLLSNAIQRLSRQRQIIISSRTKPELKLTKMLLEQFVIIIDQELLKFSTSECQVFINNHPSLQIEKLDADKLYENTSGWPAALQLTALALKEKGADQLLLKIDEGDSLEHPILNNYFLENVLFKQSPEIQTFLKQTSFLRQFSPGLCNVVAGISDSHDVIEHIVGNALFIEPFGDRGKWYRYHNLFSKFLRIQLRNENPDLVDAIHQRAAHWYHEQSQPDDAIYHALCAGDLSMAIKVMDTHALKRLYDSQLNTINQWATAIPDELLEKNHNLLVATGWAYTFLRDKEASNKIFEMIDRQREQIAKDNHLNGLVMLLRSTRHSIFDEFDKALIGAEDYFLQDLKTDAFVTIGFYNLRSYLNMMRSDFEKARVDFIAARSLAEKKPNFFTGAYAYAMSHFSQLSQGNLRGVRDCFQDGRRYLATSEHNVSIADCAFIPPYAACLYELNKCQESMELLSDSLPIIRDFFPIDWMATTYTIMSRCCYAEGKFTPALRYLEEMERHGYADDTPRLVALARWEMVRFYLLRGDHTRSEEVALGIRGETLSPAIDGFMSFPGEIEAEGISEARLQIFTGTAELALEAIKHMITACKTLRRYRLLKLNILKAMALDAVGSHRLALRVMSRALEIGREQGFIRSFVDEGERSLSLVKELRQSASTSQTDTAAYLEQVLAAAGWDAGPGPKKISYELLEPLTSREVELLQLISDGLTNRRIALQLSVTESTVKWHLSNVYSKLGVKKRTQAIAKGQYMGLIRSPGSARQL